MTDKPINYAYLYGSLQGFLQTLPYTLAVHGAIKLDPVSVNAVRILAEEAMERAKKLEREFTTGSVLS